MGLYDYPGEFAMRFDGLDSGEWCGYFTSWNPSSAPNTLHIRNLRSASPRGATLIDSFLRSKAGLPKTLIVEERGRARIARRWKISMAKTLRWQAGPGQSAGQIRVESVEITYQGIKPTW